jgi:DNA polymerase I
MANLSDSVFVVDLSWLCNLFFWASEDDNGAIKGVAFTLARLVNQFNPKYLICAYDYGKNFRHVLNPDYKKQRKEKDENFINQCKQIVILLESLSIPLYRHKDYEADDIMATIASFALKQKVPCVLVTKDKDLRQCLVQGKIGMYFKGRGWEFCSELEAEEIWGVKSSQFVDYQTLCGDAVDNIKGWSGVGPKTATALLNEYGDLKSIIDNLDSLPNKIQRTFPDFNYELAGQMVTMIDDVPIKISWQDALIGPHSNQLADRLTANKIEQLGYLLKDAFKGNN